MPDGSCAPADQVAYVDPMLGSGNLCSQNSPCRLIADALNTNHPVVKLAGMIDEAVQIDSRTITLLAEPGTQLTRTNPGVILTVSGSSVVQIVDLTIANGLGNTGIGISLPAGNSASLSLLRAIVTNNTGGGILSTGGTVNISQSTVSGNTGGGVFATGADVTVLRSRISQNAKGGLSLSGSQFDITNTFIVGNGGGGATFGGIAIDAIGQNAPAPHRVDFNTISANLGPAGANLGIACGTVLTPLTLSNNIIYMNIVSGAGRQVAGINCTTAYSDVGPDGATGTGNINTDPMFVNAAQSDFHIMATSPAKDTADPGAVLASDVDGDVRPQGLRSDMGADEVK
jgi:hypothetical protein